MRHPLAVALASVLAGAACAPAYTSSQPGPPPDYADAPPPPDVLPPPPPDAYGPAAVPPGQWVLTQQYGWVWMPYADAYAYAPPGGVGEPLEYVYYPSYGWAWISAPWVWGVGPWPRFGRPGPRRYAWYEHGWWRTPQRWRYEPGPERRGQGQAARGVRPPPPARAARRPEAAPARRPERAPPAARPPPEGDRGRGGEDGGERGRGGDRGRGDGREREGDRDRG